MHREVESRFGQYHDDGEKELGPVVATLGLGAPSKMSIRMKAKYFKGFIRPAPNSKRQPKFDPNLAILPGSQLPEQRKNIRDMLSTATKPQVEKAWQNVYKKLKSTRPIVNAPDALEIAMNHGDIVIMQGAEIQKFYEVSMFPLLSSPKLTFVKHQVVNLGDLRFALTSRHIKPSLINSSHHSKSDFDESMHPPYPRTEVRTSVGTESVAATTAAGPSTAAFMPTADPFPLGLMPSPMPTESPSSQASSSSLSPAPADATSPESAAADTEAAPTGETPPQSSSPNSDSEVMEEDIYVKNGS